MLFFRLFSFADETLLEEINWLNNKFLEVSRPCQSRPGFFPGKDRVSLVRFPNPHYVVKSSQLENLTRVSHDRPSQISPSYTRAWILPNCHSTERWSCKNVDNLLDLDEAVNGWQNINPILQEVDEEKVEDPLTGLSGNSSDLSDSEKSSSMQDLKTRWAGDLNILIVI